MFQLFLEAKEKVNENNFKIYLNRKNVQVPNNINLEKWKNFNLSERFEVVFGPNDPSRKKFKDVPYQIRIVSRKI